LKLTISLKKNKKFAALIILNQKSLLSEVEKFQNLCLKIFGQDLSVIKGARKLARRQSYRASSVAQHAARPRHPALGQERKQKMEEWLVS
jgi:hypothetical protein